MVGSQVDVQRFYLCNFTCCLMSFKIFLGSVFSESVNCTCIDDIQTAPLIKKIQHKSFC